MEIHERIVPAPQKEKIVPPSDSAAKPEFENHEPAVTDEGQDVVVLEYVPEEKTYYVKDISTREPTGPPYKIEEGKLRKKPRRQI